MSPRSHRTTSSEGESLDRYLREISVYPLIDRAEEVRLARQIHEGDAEALDQLVRANLRFVVTVAKKYQNRGVALADLINEGNIGLIRAAQKFDETRGIKFISYAVWWVRQAVLQAVAEQGQVVRVPLARTGKANRIGRRFAELSQQLGREPTQRELAAELEVSEDELTHALAIVQGALSLDAPASPEREGPLLETLVDGASRLPDEEVYDQALRRGVQRAVGILSERESRVVRMYFGLDDAEPLTLEAIGALLGVTRERVRQIRENALKKLRHHSRVSYLQTFLG
ncbi:MAG: RNA polymerase sigma factor RpoD/SigA [Gemmatimonadota bacterium]|jgi:RNA polymerase primary sigma factor|nr:RNA polymerase sigma factor RpoD/SigA [Gemmatimonadota bacterium]